MMFFRRNGATHSGNIVEVGKTGVVLATTFWRKRSPDASETPRVYSESTPGKIFILFDKIVSISCHCRRRNEKQWV